MLLLWTLPLPRQPVQSANPEEAQRRLLHGGYEANLLEAIRMTETLADQTEGGSILSIAIEGKRLTGMNFTVSSAWL